MQVKEKFILVLFLVAVFIFPLFSKDYQFDAEIQISTEKDTFLVNESTEITIKVINNKNYGPAVTPHIEWCCIVKNELGHQYPQNLFISYDCEELPMKAGEIRTYASYIQNDYGKPHPDMWALKPVLPPGTYTVQCYWKQPGYVKIESNIIRVNIIDPYGYEKKALECCWISQKYLDEKDYDRASEELSKFYTIYKESVYAANELGIKMFLHAYLKSDREKLLECSKFVLENYQDNGETRFAAVYYVLNVHELNGNKEAGIQYLENIASNTNSESLKKVIKQEIENARKVRK